MSSVTGYTTVTAVEIEDASGGLLQSGTLYATPVAATNLPSSFVDGSTSPGQHSKACVSAPVVNGAFTIQLADPTLAKPAIAYQFRIIDNNTGEDILGSGYDAVEWPTGLTFDFDTYQPNLTGFISEQYGPQGLSAYQVAVANGFSGSQSAWIASLVGAPGIASLPQLSGLLTRQPVGVNLFDYATASIGTAISSADGTTVSITNYIATDFVPVPPGGTMVMSAQTPVGGAGVAFYDQAQTFISGLSNSSTGITPGTALSVPSTAAYMRACFPNNDTSGNPIAWPTIMIVRGSTLPAVYVPFNLDATALAANGLGATSGLLPITNLFNLATIQANTAQLGAGNGTGTGILISNPGNYVSAFIPVIAGQQYTIAVGQPSSGGAGPVWFDYGFRAISGVARPYANGATVTAPAGACYFRLFGDTGDLASQMFVEGSALPSTYIPFGIAGLISTATASSGSLTTQLISETRMPLHQNLFDPANVTPNSAIGADTGALVTGTTGYYASAFIPVRPGEIYCNGFTRESGGAGGSWYDINKNFLANINPGNGGYGVGTAFTAPAGAYFVRFTGTLNDLDLQQWVHAPTLPQIYTPFGAQLPPRYGKKVAVFGDSISCICGSINSYNGGYCWTITSSYAGVQDGTLNGGWQQTLQKYLGLNYAFEDCHGGKKLADVFECYGGSATGTNRQITVTNPGTYQNTGTIGNTLAQDMATIDVCILALVTNDIGPDSGNIGAPTDAITATTFCGYLNKALYGLMAANPEMEIVLVGPMQSGYASFSVTQQFDTAMAACCALLSIRYLSLFTLSGVNPNNWSTRYQADSLNVHPTPAFSHALGGMIAGAVAGSL